MVKQKRFNQFNSSGFSLVELMVVVAIIGILASVAVPQFQKFTFKARLTEAKAGLSSLYTAEKAFYGEWSQFDTHFGVIGYAPEGNYSFNIGFNAAVTSNAYTIAGNVIPTESPAVETHVYGFCDMAGATRCKNMPTSVETLERPAAAFIANFDGLNGCRADNSAPPKFVACATASAALNPENAEVRLVINHAKDIRQNVP